MGTFALVIYLRTIWMVWLSVFFSFATSFTDFDDWYDPPAAPVVYTYNRFDEIQEKCGPLLSSASELEPDDYRGSKIKKEHSFETGDWDQESGGAPLMPFDDRDMERKHEGPGAFLKLASFWVVDVDPVRRAQNMVGISGIMEIGITGDQHFDYSPFGYRSGWSPNFRMNPGFSSMRILFEGVYIESEENGGERLICSLGTSMVPTTNQYTQSEELADGYGYKLENQPHLVQDDQIMLVLRYSKSFSLTTGNISGEMQSLHDKSSFKYFDRVHISSQLGRHSKYEFGAEELLSKACSPYPYQDSLVDEDIFSFRDDNFCNTVQHFLTNVMFEIVPSWKSVGSNDDATKLCPFVLSRKTKATDGGSNNFGLLVQNLHCDPGIDENKIKTARVFALFRAIHSWENGYTSEGRTGLSGMTLSAEGMWRSSEGQLCMVGCLGIAGTASDRCNSRICLYFPHTFSINQRNPVFGTITSTNNPESHTPLWFGRITQPEIMLLGLYQESTNLEWSYKYSKIIQAKAFRMRSKTSFLGISMRKSFLEYPSPNGSDKDSLSPLANDLSLRVSAVPYVFYKSQTQKIHVNLEILSLGSLFGPYWPRKCRSHPEVEKSVDLNADMIETSGLLTIIGEHFNNISFSFEGIYDSSVGNLYLVGCRDVRVSQKNIKEEMNLEGGMDCLFEVKVEYPSTNARWLKNPEVKISVSSKRSKEDFLYINPISLKTKPISYDKQLPDVIFRKTFEEILRVLILVMAIFCTRSQLHYLKNVDPIGYVSLTMIHIPVVDYISPLICRGEIFFKWKAIQSDSYRTYDLKSYERFNMFTYAIKSLSLYALLLTFNLGKKVSESGRRQIGREQQGRLQNEKKIFLITSAVHIIGFLVTHVIHTMIATETVPQSDENVRTRSKLLQWLTELDGYLCLIPDLFLLPQIVANTLWQNKGKPLRKLYYLGLTCLRVLLHLYDCIRDTLPDLIYDEFGYQYVDIDSYSRFGNILTVIIVIVLAVILYKQQK